MSAERRVLKHFLKIGALQLRGNGDKLVVYPRGDDLLLDPDEKATVHGLIVEIIKEEGR